MKKPLKLFLCCFLTVILLFSATRINEIKFIQNNNKNEYPNLSADEILINTPENITYTEPVSGYYPATYGFENDEVGSDPEGWITSDTGATIEVIDEIDEHKRVVRLDEGTLAEGWDGMMYNLSTPLLNGTIEFYWRFDSLQNEIYFQTRDSTGYDVAITIGLFTDYDWRYSGDYFEIPNVDDPQTDYWYPIRLDFRFTGAPEYMGLNEQKFQVMIDGISSGELDIKSGTSDLYTFWIGTGTSCANVNLYYDAFGFSWDPNYNIGDNLNKGLLLSYKNTTSLEWQGYSLDGQANKTILGNTTIPFPTQDGVHTIQVFGNNSGGLMYESNMRYFSVKHINIITPENITYTEPMNGYYPGTYGFESERDLSFPVGWVNNSEQDTNARVISELDGHKKVIKFDDDSSLSQAVVEQNLSSAQINGTFELWIRSTNVRDSFLISITDNTNSIILFYLGKGVWGVYGQTYWTPIYGMRRPLNNTWYHVRIDFECSNGGYMGLPQYNYRVYVNGYSSSNLQFRTNCNQIKEITLRTNKTCMDYQVYLDSIGYSWDPNYNIGDNLNEGLLLSYENSTSLEWQGYSLDGQVNKTIIGNTTIPIPANGQYFIQVFGNNSGGVMYESDIRYFTVDITLSIITPENKTYTEPMGGYYPATYGFEEDAVGTTDTGIKMLDSNSYPICIIESGIDGHNNVLSLTSDNFWCGIDDYVSDQSSGTIEWWIRTPQSDLSLEFKLWDLGQIGPFIFFQNDSYIYAKEDGSPSIITSYSYNTWIHVRVDFECGSGNYQGLSPDMYYVYINGTRYGPYNFLSSVSAIDKVQMHSYGGSNTRYIDAVGYSWDPYYNVGDNMNEGLLLSYNTGFTHDWQGYSLDGLANITILGNTTIPMPADGTYSIQVFGNNSGGVMYESDTRYFTVDTYVPPPVPVINIITPENITYTEPISTLFLSFETNTNLDWIGYSLDGQANITITGNTTIPMPADGVHFIQVFGNNSEGVMNGSNVRYFTVIQGNISIITPENITYTEPMSGYYPATYGFENDEVGSDPEGWITSDTGATIEVIDEIDEHKRVVRLDEGTLAEGWDGLTYNLSAPLLYGTIEFYWRFDSLQNEIYFQTRDSTGYNVAITIGLFTDFDWRYSGDYFDIPNVDNPQINYWYPIRLDFRFTGAPTYMGLNEQKFQVTIDGISSGELDIKSGTSDLYTFWIGTGPSCANVNLYYDAFGFSWDPNYNIGDNLNEGLLLSYENSTSLEWQGYSLDGQANKTILGNTTIPMPADGVHFIQVFGNNSEGVMNGSNIRYFMVDTTAPIISGIDIIIELEQYSYYSLDWNIIDISGGTYTIFKNGSLESAGSFQNNDEISIIVDTNELGYSIYTIVAVDLFDRVTNHSVIVKIVSEDQPEPGIPGFNVLIVFVIACITIGIIIKSKFKIKK